jgi:SpoIID/LytB domain protein
MSGRHAARLSFRKKLQRAVLGLAAMVLVAGTVTGGAPAQAATGDLTITGHGFGHGRGLSQWGAYGFATQHGWNHLQILARYYSNATLGSIGNPLLTVRLTALDGVETEVTSQAPFTIAGWTLAGGTAVKISRLGDGSWQMTTRFGCGGAVGGTVPISSTVLNTVNDPGNDVAGMLNVCDTGRAFRGALSVVADGGALRTVNHVFMQDYLRGVVPRESPASWGSAAGGAGLNALMAQAVAARSYAWAENRASYAKTCDTTACQVYGGAGLNGARIEDARTDAAVANTGGEVMMLNGQVARTEFSSSTGGYTAGGTFPAVPDEGDSVSPYYDWSVTLAGSTVSAAFGVGALQSVTVLSRNGLGRDGGRVTKVRVTGASRSVEVSGSDFRSKLGLRSDWFTPGQVEGAATPAPWPQDISPASVTAVKTHADSVVTFVRGVTGSLWYTTAAGGAFSPFKELPFVSRTAPSAVSTDGYRIDLFAVGSDQALWHTSTIVDASGYPTTFLPWESLGGALTAAPSAASSHYGDLIVAGRGVSGDLFARALSGGSWTPWQSLGGGAISAPAVDVMDVGTFRVQAVGTDGVVWSTSVSASTATATTGWTSTGMRTGFAPAVSGHTWWTANIKVLATSNGLGIRQTWNDGTVVDLGGGVTSSVAVVEWGSSSTWTFARGQDEALWLNIESDPAAPSSWFRIGGRLA